MFKKILLTAALAASFVYAAVPRPLVDMIIPLPQGKPLALKAYRGKVLLVAMITTDCKTCQASIEVLSHLQNDFGTKEFQVVAVAGDQNAQYMIEPFVQRFRPTFPVGYLTADQMALLGDIRKEDRHFAPIMMFVDRKGVVRQQIYGDNPIFKNEEPSLRKMVQDMLKP
jgi:thiol-disulfide isomerase/thioredoxin